MTIEAAMELALAVSDGGGGGAASFGLEGVAEGETGGEDARGSATHLVIKRYKMGLQPGWPETQTE